jgi:hypothetical protein
MEYVLLKVNPYGVLYVVTAFCWAIYAAKMSYELQVKHIGGSGSFTRLSGDYIPAVVWAVLAFIVNIILCLFAIL